MTPRNTALAAAVFVLCGILRAMLDNRAGATLFRAADQTIARECAAQIRREPRSKAGVGSAAVASLVVQKLPLPHS